MSSSYYGAGVPFSGFRYTVTNLAVPSIAAVTTTEVQVTLAGVKVGDSGFFAPRDQKMLNGMALLPIRVTADNTAQLPFCNASAGALDVPDTVDYDVYVFRATGNLQAAV